MVLIKLHRQCHARHGWMDRMSYFAHITKVINLLSSDDVYGTHIVLRGKFNLPSTCCYYSSKT
jgi:hypothetical protein